MGDTSSYERIADEHIRRFEGPEAATQRGSWLHMGIDHTMEITLAEETPSDPEVVVFAYLGYNSEILNVELVVRRNGLSRCLRPVERDSGLWCAVQSWLATVRLEDEAAAE